MLFCVLNVFIYCFPAHWMWGPNGWLKELGAKDIAGAGVVHALGGSSSEIINLYIKIICVLIMLNSDGDKPFPQVWWQVGTWDPGQGCTPKETE